MPKVPKGWGIARNAFADTVIADTSGSFWSDTATSLADAKAEAVTGCVIVMVACPAGNIAVAAQDGIVEQQLSDPGLCRVDGQEMLWHDRI